MKTAIIALIFLIMRAQAACLPELSAFSSIDESSAFLPVAEERAIHFEKKVEKTIAKDWDIVVRLDVLNPRTNAQINTTGEVVVIEVWGGMLNQGRMDEDVLTLLLCHELGHLLGGPPLKSRNGWSSTEGQSDYYSAASCANIMGMSDVTFYQSAEKLTHIYADVTGESYPELRTCDPSIRERTNFGYPSVQCRLDTLVAGWTKKPRPHCWFKE